MTPIALDDRTWLLVLTGAGVSAESGIETFRAKDGLWENHRIEDVATPEGFAGSPARVWRFYSERRAKAKASSPNPGHVALAGLEQFLGERFLLVTQNVDDLHRRAGSRRLVELHGHLFTSRCSACDRDPFTDEGLYLEGPLPRCDQCGGLLRPHIVWFGEPLFEEDERAIQAFISKGACERLLFVAVGTSGVVYPAAGLVERARSAGAETWLVNADPADNLARFHHFIRGKSGEILPSLFSYGAKT